jgi:hypothetical protein
VWFFLYLKEGFGANLVSFLRVGRGWLWFWKVIDVVGFRGGAYNIYRSENRIGFMIGFRVMIAM